MKILSTSEFCDDIDRTMDSRAEGQPRKPRRYRYRVLLVPNRILLQ